MKLYIDEIPEEGFDLKIAEETVEHDVIVAPVHADLRVGKTGTEVLLSGNVTATVKLCCSRCLKDFRREMTVPVDVVYHPVEELKGDETYEIRNGKYFLRSTRDVMSDAMQTITTTINLDYAKIAGIDLPASITGSSQLRSVSTTMDTRMNIMLSNCRIE